MSFDPQRHRGETVHKTFGNELAGDDFAAISLQTAAAIMDIDTANQPDQAVGNSRGQLAAPKGRGAISAPA